MVFFFFFSVGEFDESFHVLRRHRGVFEPLSYSEKRGERVVFGGVRKGARKRARSVRDAQTIAFKPRAILFSVECAKKTARSRVACALRRALPGNTRETWGRRRTIVKIYALDEKVLKSRCRRFVFERSRVKCCLPSFPRRRFFYTESRGLLFSRSFFESVSEIGRRRSRGAFARARVSNLAFFGWISREDLCVE